MKALTVRQPMAWAIAVGLKPDENRSRATSYRGDLAIHAGKWDRDYATAVKQLLVELGELASVDEQVSVRRDLLVTGVVVSVVDLFDVCPGRLCRCGAWAAIGFKHWKFRDARPLADPIPATGRLGLWDIDLKGVA